MGQNPAVQFCGLPLERSRNAQFYLLAVGSLFCSFVFAGLQEKVFRIEGFTYGGWLTFLTYVTYSLCGLVEWLGIQGGKRLGSGKDYAVVAATATLGYYCTNWSLQYLNYATRIVFKSSKVLPVMLFSAAIQRQRHSVAEYAAGGLLVAGISTFTMGDRDSSASFNAMGVALITLALVFDAISANLEEARFFRREQPCSQAEVVACMCGCAAVYSAVVLVLTGELAPALKHSLEHPEVPVFICASSLLGYMSVVLILLLIQHFGATTTEVVKSMRKVLQVLLSFLLFPKPMNTKYLAGGLMVAGALLWLQRLSQRRPLKHEHASDNQEVAVDLGVQQKQAVKGSLSFSKTGVPLLPLEAMMERSKLMSYVDSEDEVTQVVISPRSPKGASPRGKFSIKAVSAAQHACVA